MTPAWQLVYPSVWQWGEKHFIWCSDNWDGLKNEALYFWGGGDMCLENDFQSPEIPFWYICVNNLSQHPKILIFLFVHTIMHYKAFQSLLNISKCSWVTLVSSSSTEILNIRRKRWISPVFILSCCSSPCLTLRPFSFPVSLLFVPQHALQRWRRCVASPLKRTCSPSRTKWKSLWAEVSQSHCASSEHITAFFTFIISVKFAFI